MKPLFAASLLLALSACATTPSVSTDHAAGADFSKYHSYSWLAEPDGASPLIAQRIVAGVDAQLQAKGWTKVASGGDASVAAHVATQQNQSVETFYSGPAYAGWGWRGGMRMGMGMGMSTTDVRTYNVGTLVVDLFDTATKQAIWRGTATKTVSSSLDKVNADVDAGVRKMFADFPPGSGGK